MSVPLVLYDFSFPELHIVPPSEQPQSTAPVSIISESSTSSSNLPLQHSVCHTTSENSTTHEVSTAHNDSYSASVLAHDAVSSQPAATVGNGSHILPVESMSPVQGNGDGDATQSEAVEPSPTVSNTHTMVTRSKAATRRVPG
ncbi:hypothetical protein V6N13_013873 [Hibiscus sabdariffa]